MNSETEYAWNDLPGGIAVDCSPSVFDGCLILRLKEMTTSDSKMLKINYLLDKWTPAVVAMPGNVSTWVFSGTADQMGISFSA